MTDDRSRTLPATANLVKPPLLARSVLRSFNDFAEGELVLRFADLVPDPDTLVVPLRPRLPERWYLI